jgi:taurine dioxygenase
MQITMNRGLTVNPLSDVMGAEVLGADLSRPLDDAAFGQIQQAFHDHQVIAVRDQKLSPQAQVVFTERFGSLEPHNTTEFVIQDAPLVLIISNDMKDGKPIGVIDAGDFWHSDSSHRKIPSKATVLHSVKNPSAGGDTQFSNMYLAYETLPKDVQRRIEGLQGIHAASKLKNKRVEVSKERPGATDFYASRLDRPDVTHPIVMVHPVTGRKALYMSQRFTIGIPGIPEDEADELLDFLFAHQLKADFQYHHKWREGDVVMWDNRCVLHRAGGGYQYPDVRRLHKTVLAGDRPQ